MRLFSFFVLIGNILFLGSCKKHVPADKAFFLQSSSVGVTTSTIINQGSGTHNITDFWLYTNGKFQGVYPVGSIMPIISKGERTKINLFGGIKNNGISNTRLSWVFYNFITIDTLVENGKIINRPINFTYNSNTIFDWLEDFEGSGISLINSAVSQTTLVPVLQPEALDNKSIKMQLTGSQTMGLAESSISYVLPTGSSNVYLEIDYKSNQEFEVGLIGSSDDLKPAIYVTPKDNWSHIYIQLSNAVSSGNVSSSYRVYFRMVKTADYPVLYLDNIKLMHL